MTLMTFDKQANGRRTAVVSVPAITSAMVAYGDSSAADDNSKSALHSFRSGGGGGGSGGWSVERLLTDARLALCDRPGNGGRVGGGGGKSEAAGDGRGGGGGGLAASNAAGGGTVRVGGRLVRRFVNVDDNVDDVGLRNVNAVAVTPSDFTVPLGVFDGLGGVGGGGSFLSVAATGTANDDGRTDPTTAGGGGGGGNT